MAGDLLIRKIMYEYFNWEVNIFVSEIFFTVFVPVIANGILRTLIYFIFYAIFVFASAHTYAQFLYRHKYLYANYIFIYFEDWMFQKISLHEQLFTTSILTVAENMQLPKSSIHVKMFLGRMLLFILPLKFHEIFT